jgi:WD40 repeat protein
MKNQIIFLAALFVLSFSSLSGAEPDVIWTKNLGDEIERLDFVQDGKFILAGSGTQLYKLTVDSGEINLLYNRQGNNYCLSPDKTKLYIANDFNINVINVATGELVDSIIIEKTRQFTHQPQPNGDTTQYLYSYIGGTMITPDSSKLLGFWTARGYIDYPSNPKEYDFKKVLIIDINTKQVDSIIQFGNDNSTAENFSPDGKYLAIGYSDGLVEICTLPYGMYFINIQADSYLKTFKFLKE